MPMHHHAAHHAVHHPMHHAVHHNMGMHHYAHHHYHGRMNRRPVGMIVNGQFHTFTLPYDIKRYRAKRIIAIFFFIMSGIEIFDAGFEFAIGSMFDLTYLAPAVLGIFNFLLFYLLPFISIFAESIAVCSHCAISISLVGGIGILVSHILTGVFAEGGNTSTYLGISISLGVLMFLCNITYLILYSKFTNAGYFIEATKKLMDDIKNAPAQPVIVGQTVVDQYGMPLTIGQPQIQVQYPPGQYPVQYPAQYPGQFPGQYPGQFPQQIYAPNVMIPMPPQQQNANMAASPIYNGSNPMQPVVNAPLPSQIPPTPMQPVTPVEAKAV